MTRPIAVLVLLLSPLLAMPVQADDELDPIDYCRDMSLIAKEVMTARQQNKPMSETLPRAIDRFKALSNSYGVGSGMEHTEEGAAILVTGAYEQTVSSSKEYKLEKISEFENAVFQSCYEAVTSARKE